MIKIKKIEWILITSYFVFVFIGYKEFNIWPQITYILKEQSHNDNINAIWDLFIHGQVHFLRILLIAPYYFFGEFLSIGTNFLFSISLVFFIYWLYLLTSFPLKHIVKRSSLTLILIFYIMMSLFMNGRLIFAMLANSILLCIFYINFFTIKKLSIKKTSLFFILSLWLSSVSTGTFMVFILSSILFLCLMIIIDFPIIKRVYLLWLAGLTFFLIIISPLILSYIVKNLDFYHGSVISMLSHGMGVFVKTNIYLTFLTGIFLTILLFKVLIEARKNKIILLPLSIIISSCAIGLFGYSSLLSGMPAFIIFTYLYLFGSLKNNDNYQKPLQTVF